MDDSGVQGNPLRLDPDAESADPNLPAFLARPADAPVYHGFLIIEESRTKDGWRFGLISDPDCPEGLDGGDAFVVAPDNSRAGLAWDVGPSELTGELDFNPDRWGVFSVGIERLVHSQAELVEQLLVWLPELRRLHARWVAWRSESNDSDNSIPA